MSALPVQLCNVAIESLKFGEKIGPGKIAVHKTYTIETVQRSDQAVSGLFYGPHMPDGNVTGNTYQCKILIFLVHGFFCSNSVRR
jgi:hypothetical protein